MNTETYERLLAMLDKRSTGKQAESETMESDWLKGFYAGQAVAYKSAGTMTRMLNGDYSTSVMMGIVNATNL